MNKWIFSNHYRADELKWLIHLFQVSTHHKDENLFLRRVDSDSWYPINSLMSFLTSDSKKSLAFSLSYRSSSVYYYACYPCTFFLFYIRKIQPSHLPSFPKKNIRPESCVNKVYFSTFLVFICKKRGLSSPQITNLNRVLNSLAKTLRSFIKVLTCLEISTESHRVSKRFHFQSTITRLSGFQRSLKNLKPLEKVKPLWIVVIHFYRIWYPEISNQFYKASKSYRSLNESHQRLTRSEYRPNKVLRNLNQL